MEYPYEGIGIIRNGKKVSAVRDRKMVHDGLPQPFRPNIGNFLYEVLSATPYKPDGLEFLLLSPKIAPTLIVSLISVIIISPNNYSNTSAHRRERRDRRGC